MPIRSASHSLARLLSAKFQRPTPANSVAEKRRNCKSVRFFDPPRSCTRATSPCTMQCAVGSCVGKLAESVSFAKMTHEQALRARKKLLDRLSLTGEILRGSLLERTVFRHKANCERCSSGEGHPLNVLTITYSGGRTRQFSLRPELVP